MAGIHPTRTFSFSFNRRITGNLNQNQHVVDAAHPHFPHRACGHKLQEGRYSSAPAHSGQGCMHTGSHRSISQHPKRKRGVGGAPQRKACQAHAFTCNLTARLSPAPAEGPLSKQALLQRGTGATVHTTGRRGSTVLCGQKTRRNSLDPSPRATTTENSWLHLNQQMSFSTHSSPAEGTVLPAPEEVNKTGAHHRVLMHA